MNLELNKKDLLYLGLTILFSYFLLSQTNSIPIDSYNTLAELKQAGIDLSADPLIIAPILGMIVTAIFYISARWIIKMSSLSSISATILAVTSASFTNSFTAGMMSTPVQLILGVFDLTISFEYLRLADNLLLIPLTLFAIYILTKRKENNFRIFTAIGLISLILTPVFPLLSIFILVLFNAYGFEQIENSTKRDQMLLSALLGAAIVLTLVEISVQTLALSFLVGALVAAIVYTVKFGRSAVIALTVILIFSSFIIGSVNSLSSESFDDETLEAISQLKGLRGDVASATVYGESLSSASLYLSNKKIDAKKGVEFLFSTTPPKFDYLLLDSIVLDAPRNLSRSINLSARFDVFIPAGLGREGSQIFSYYVSENSVLRILSDEQGRVISDRVFVDSENISLFRLLQINASDSAYSRYIYPRRETDLNVFKLLFPDKFGGFGEGDNEKNATLIWESNSSRMKLFRIR